MYSFLTVHSWRFLPILGEVRLLFVSWWLWLPLGFLFQLFLDKWCHGPVCSWCMSGLSWCSFFYLEVSSIWFINGERQQHFKQDPSLLMWNLQIMTLEKVSWIDLYQFIVLNVLSMHEMFSMLDFRLQLKYADSCCISFRSSATGFSLWFCYMVLWNGDGTFGCHCPIAAGYVWGHSSVFEVILLWWL